MNRFPSFLAVALLVLLPCILTGCDSNDNSPPDDFDLVGTWAITGLEGAPGPVDASNSTWRFDSDGTYQWFFFYPGFFDLQGGGTYTFQGTTLTVDGIVDETVISHTPSGVIQLTLDANTFSFRDDDGDRWTYVKQD